MRRYQKRFRALGSSISLTLLADDQTAVTPLFDLLFLTINDFEQRFSRFLPDSELTRLNQQAGQKTTISRPMHALLETSRQLAVISQGMFNPMILPGLVRSGYAGSIDDDFKLHHPALDYSRRRVYTLESLKLGEQWVELPADAALDLGGIGKGYLLDELAKLVDEQHLDNYWLSLGGDIICSGQDIDGADWQVAIASALSKKPIKPTITCGTAKLAIATSGTIKRRGDNWHHLIDPATQRPAVTDILSATVIAERGVLADVLAKTVVIGGQVMADDYLNRKLLSAYLLQFANGTIVHKGELIN